MRSEDGGGRAWFAAVSILLLTLLASSVSAQRGEGRGMRAEVDPYTKGSAKAMEKAGYGRFGPFAWAEDHTTEVAEEVLGGVPILWVETEHFKIGSSLDGYKYTEEPKEKKKIQAELKQLKKRIPGIKSKVKVLDPWLRLHLWAMRLEDQYDSFLEEFGFTDEMFPAPPGTVPYVGEGKYLGLKGKFCVLLLQKKSSFARYTSTFCNRPVETTYRFFFQKTGTMFFGMAMDSLEGSFHNDSAMHHAVAFNVAQNLGNGYRGYTHEAPLWWNVGLARWFARRADPRWLLYTASKTAGVRFDEKESLWEQKVRARVEKDYYPTMSELMLQTDFNEVDFAGHMMMWSRVDYIMSLDSAVKRELLTILQEPAAWSGAVAHDGSLEDQFSKALVQATGLELEEFDRRWVSYVKKRYPKK